MEKRTIHPSPSFEFDVPAEAVEKVDGEVASFWIRGSTVLLQVSSYLRTSGAQVSAAQRLASRLNRGGLRDIRPVTLGPEACPDRAAVAASDDEGTHWVFAYAVWPDLTILASVSKADDLAVADWAFDAVESIRRARGTG